MPSASSKPARHIERSYSNPVPRKRRAVKRRGRTQDEFESDEEIVREVRTDSETDDDNSSIDSDSDSESTSSDLHADVHSEVVTPSTTQSPPPVELDRLANGGVKDPSSSQAGIFADTTNWAEMVAGEAENGAADLPVIDFADMASNHLPEPRAPSPAHRSRKSHKAVKKSAAARATSAPPPAALTSQEEPAEEQFQEQGPVASTSDEPHPHSALPSRSRGQTARQAYQQRLESDPSFVPKVGEFWGHDDRLLDKDLRSLSGWWRGRWQSRGRGRGAFSMRGRGRSGFFPSRSSPRDESVAPEESADVPPVERPWTHDGFEEMKRRDERRRALQEQQQANAVLQRGFGFRGRGFVPARGRGGAFARGGSPTATQRPLTSNVSMGDRVWYAQKPERMWTKQHDIFLYNDAATKPRPGVGPGVRVKLPGGKVPLIVRLPPRTSTARASDKPEETPSPSLDAEKPIIVRMPAAFGKTKVVEEVPVASAGGEELATTVEELSIEEVFTVRPNAVPNRRIDFSVPSPSVPTAHAPQAVSGQSKTPSPQLSQPAEVDAHNPIEQLSILPIDGGSSSPSVQIQETILRNPLPSEDTNLSPSVTAPGEESQSRPEPPILHPLQTSFSPVPPPTSPPYGSPYGYAPALPPGVGVNSQGMAYEYATGRAVYIQPTPPPMYTPRPMMHGHHPSMSIPFVPSHLRHHSAASPDFLAHPHTPHTHTPIQSFVDPTTGVPIFSPARQSSRIEIRAPTEAAESKKPTRASHQRSNLSVAYPAEGPYYPQQDLSVEDVGATDEALSQPPMGHAHTPSMESIGYAPYPQPYYYPEQYGYPPYVDMSGQMMQYEMYPPEHQHHPSQPVVYY
ncbi:hypothetical protein DICSQDRAFT_135946 [Dichomitus squalens LYAD-421 SS1]|uniref:Btz domain-containing protein n=1 Tax=Dichomitus squalens (strain LYAD-421) TaxID=732165 RepID=R7T2I5_DICSQ|nr:uncharacterized protein DICSQDRAFT_135946 [Dichomitus squalens LYAD-421 SS1]EJF62355.1 hypothetical protein DICSQDRAFT_135946 [Dichomitus squalens LYAD-421 SS1]